MSDKIIGPLEVTPTPDDAFKKLELLDRSFMISKIFHDFVLDHLFTSEDEEISTLANKISEDLGELYQLIGAKAM